MHFRKFKDRVWYHSRRFLYVLVMMSLAFVTWGCSHKQSMPDYIYALGFGQDVQTKYGSYKCSYAHYRNGVPTSGSEDIFTVEVGTVISYGGHSHTISEGEIFDANSWFTTN